MCPTPIEGLATNGIVHFDPDAYIRDGVSEYISEPDSYLPFDRPMYASPFPAGYPAPVMRPQQPYRDVYTRHEHHEKHSGSWLGILAGAAVGALGTVLGYEILKDKDNTAKSGAAPEVKPEATPESKTEGKPDIKTTITETGEKVKEKAKGFWGNVKDFAKRTKDRVVSWVQGKKSESSVDKVVNDAAKGPIKEQTGFFKTRFRKTKIGLGIAAGLTVLYMIYKAFTGRSKHSAHSQNSHNA